MQNGAVVMHLLGDWSVFEGIPTLNDMTEVSYELRPGTVIKLKSSQLGVWDSSVPLFVLRLNELCRRQQWMLDTSDLPEAVSILVSQAKSATGQVGVEDEKPTCTMREVLGKWAIKSMAEAKLQLAFLGNVILALGSYVPPKNKKATIGSFAMLLQQAGPSAVPIITLISLLVGMILAFVGAVQLRQFGAQLYIADLVGLGMAREMGAMMTAVIIAGRTGAAYAAELGTMRANEEIDALHTLGMDPVQHLVVPRIAALMLVMPLLCVYANGMGVLGGALVSAGLFDISFLEYFNECRAWVHMVDFNIGIVKSAVFAALVALAGCMRGMRCGSHSGDVGYAATSAVVTAIIWVVVADAVLTLMIATLNI